MNWVPSRLSHVLIEEHTDSHIIYLSEIGGERRLPIMIGPIEANSIQRAVCAEHFSRPLTHDLLAEVIAQTGFNCDRIRIVDLKEGTYYADIELQRDNQTVTIDCRPSDAIALLSRMPGITLEIAEHVFESAEP